MKPLIIIALVLISSAAFARDRGPETCESYERATGTVVTEYRRPEHKPTRCGSYTNITGTTHTECR
jgi:hypothetical protein